jgi:hypothetical protein
MKYRSSERAAAILGLVILGVTGCGAPGSDHVAAATASGTGGTAPSTLPSVAPDSLAPAGPAPGGGPGEAEDHLNAQLTSLVSSLGCDDVETQSHLAAVDSQITCRSGTERLFMMTFRSSLDRDNYLTQGPQVVDGGFNVVGPTWIVHTESATTAQHLGGQLNGAVQSGP